MRPQDYSMLESLSDDTEIYTQGAEGEIRGDFKFTIGILKKFLRTSKPEKIIITTETTSLTITDLPEGVDFYRNGILMYEGSKNNKNAMVFERDGNTIYVSTRFPFRTGELIQYR